MVAVGNLERHLFSVRDAARILSVHPTGRLRRFARSFHDATLATAHENGSPTTKFAPHGFCDCGLLVATLTCPDH
jgi:hypothetical protein